MTRAESALSTAKLTTVESALVAFAVIATLAMIGGPPPSPKGRSPRQAAAHNALPARKQVRTAAHSRDRRPRATAVVTAAASGQAPGFTAASTRDRGSPVPTGIGR